MSLKKDVPLVTEIDHAVINFQSSKSWPKRSMTPYPYALARLSHSQHIDLDAFAETVDVFNTDNIINIAILLNQVLSNVPDNLYCLLVTGSDARRENCINSQFELCLVCENSNTAKEILSLLKKNFSALTKMASSPLPISQNIECKILGKDSCISGFNGNPNFIWADRVMSAQLVSGSFELLYKTKLRVIDEQHQSPVRKRMRKNVHFFENATKSGVTSRNGSLQQHFSIKDGLLFFDPSNYVKGLKYSVLRLIQQHLTLHEVTQNCVDNDPNTRKKIFQLQQPSSQEGLRAYLSALWTYHVQTLLWDEYAEARLYVGEDLLNNIISQALLFVANNPIG